MTKQFQHVNNHIMYVQQNFTAIPVNDSESMSAFTFSASEVFIHFQQ